MPHPTKWVSQGKEVEAVLLTPENAHRVALWCDAEVWEDRTASAPKNIYLSLLIPTFYGRVTALPGDYVVKLSDGEFEALTKEKFLSKYVKVEEAK